VHLEVCHHQFPVVLLEHLLEQRVEMVLMDFKCFQIYHLVQAVAVAAVRVKELQVIQV
jgi:hypothetical protein